MEPQSIQFFANACGGQILNISPERVVSAVSTDSRSIKKGELFVALVGDNFNGHDFLVDVCAKGAAAAVVAEERLAALPPGVAAMAVKDTRHALGAMGRAYRDLFDITAIAVAGSNGKTSAKELIAAALKEKLEIIWSAASFNNDIGVPLTLLQIEKTHRAGVFEVGTNHPGELRPLLTMIRPSIGIITSIGREHLEFFGDIEGVLQEEGTLAEMLPRGGLLVINGDGFGAAHLAHRTEARVVRVGFEAENEMRIRDVEMGPDGTQFTVETEAREYSGNYRTKLLGKHQVVNAAYAIVVGMERGLGRAEIQRGLASCPGPKMRLQLKQIDDFVVLDDAYNANADSMQAALETLQRFPCRGRRIAVLGEMAELGESSAPAHQEVGRRAAEGKIDFLVAVGKSSAIMASAARGAGLRQVLEMPEVEQAGPVVTEMVRPGDVVLVKASRAAKLERVVEFLSQKFGASEARMCATGA